MATFVSDTFTDTNGTALTAHTGETGATWAQATGLGGTNPGEITSNRVRPDGASFGAHYASGAPASAEYDVQADLHVVTVIGDTVGVAGRLHQTAGDGYLGLYRAGSETQWELYKVVGGSYTLLGTFDQALAAGNTYALKLEIKDGAKKLYVNGVERISSGDNAVTAANKAGVWLEANTSDTAGMHLDNFLASDPAAGDYPWAVRRRRADARRRRRHLADSY